MDHSEPGSNNQLGCVQWRPPLLKPCLLWQRRRNRRGLLPDVWIMDCFPAGSVQSLSRVRLFVTPWTAVRQASCPSPTPRAHSNSCPLSRWCHATISSSVVPFSSLLQSFPGGTIGKEPTCRYRWFKRCRCSPWVGKIPWSRKCNPLQYSCLENPHRQRSPVGYSS